MEVFEVAISPKGQLTLPKELREKYHLNVGEKALLVPGKEGVVIKHPCDTTRGLWAGRIDSKAFDEELKKLRREWRL